MKNVLVAYFSATGTTGKLAEKLSAAVGADLHEILPKEPYTAADLDWTDKNSRSSVEMNNKTFRPETVDHVENMEQYDTVFVAFPIWWYVAPTIINTFLETYDLKGKRVVPVATSGGSGMGRTNRELAVSCEGARLEEGKVFDVHVSPEELRLWAEAYI